MLICRSFYLLYYALNRGQNEDFTSLCLFCEYFGNSVREFSFSSNLSFNLVSRIQGP